MLPPARHTHSSGANVVVPRPTAGPPAPPRRPLPFTAVLLGAALFMAALWPRLGSGRLWHHDEILTAERAREMLTSGDPWAVRLNGRPDFHKPPAQYWLTAGLLRAWPGEPERAVRLPSVLLAALGLVATAALGRVAWPDDPVAGPAAALAVAGCGFWVHFTRMGMLDAGAALGVTGTLWGAELARKRGRPGAAGWWLAAVAATLGAWQKAPYALGAWAVALLGRVWRRELSPAPARWPKSLRAALGVSLALTLGWPAWQLARFGWAAVVQGQAESTGNLFNLNKSAGFEPWRYAWWLVRDWGAFGLLAPVAAGVAIRRGTSPAAPGGVGDPFRREIGVMLALGWSVVACLPYRTERYLVFLLPLAALLVVRFLRRDAAGRPRRFGGVLLAGALASTVPVAAFHYGKPWPDRSELLAAARDFGAVCRSDPAAVPIVDQGLATGINVPFFVLFYGELFRPVTMVGGWTERAVVRADRVRPGERVVGLNWVGTSEAFTPTRELSRHGGWVVWETVP